MSETERGTADRGLTFPAAVLPTGGGQGGAGGGFATEPDPGQGGQRGSGPVSNRRQKDPLAQLARLHGRVQATINALEHDLKLYLDLANRDVPLAIVPDLGPPHMLAIEKLQELQKLGEAGVAEVELKESYYGGGSDEYRGAASTVMLDAQIIGLVVTTKEISRFNKIAEQEREFLVQNKKAIDMVSLLSLLPPARGVKGAAGASLFARVPSLAPDILAKLMRRKRSFRTWRRRIYREWAAAERKIAKRPRNKGGRRPMFSEANLREMEAGRAPKIEVVMRNREKPHILTKRQISLELSHEKLTQRMKSRKGNQPWNLELSTPWQHEAIDPHRFVGWDFVYMTKGR